LHGNYPALRSTALSQERKIRAGLLRGVVIWPESSYTYSVGELRYMALASDQWNKADDSVAAVVNAGLYHRYLLVLRFALINIIAAGLVTAIYLRGWLDAAFSGYTLWCSLLIIGVFLFGLVLAAMRVWRTSVELNDIKAGTPRPASKAAKYLSTIQHGTSESRVIATNVLRLRLSQYISIVYHVANMLVFLGLVGTVIGFIIALSGVDPRSAVTVESVAPMVSTLITGMSIALYTTLIGAVLHVWLMINYRLLASGTTHLFNATLEYGEGRVGK
jgi:hypothetical protein